MTLRWPFRALLALLSIAIFLSPNLAWSRGGIGGGGGGGGAVRGGGGLSGGGFQPQARPTPSIQRTQTPSFNRPSGGASGGGSLGGGAFGGDQRANVVHMPGTGGGVQMGSRQQIHPEGAITRPELAGGNRAEFRPGGDFRSGGDARPNLPGGVNAGASTANLPGLGGNRLGNLGPGGAGGAGERSPVTALRPGAGGAGERLPGMNTRPGAGGAGTRFPANSVPDRHQNLNHQFDQMNQNWGNGDWHSWAGPNGGQINHVGFWGPNGYWGHTGAWGADGGHLGHTTGIGTNGAYGRTVGWGPNGNVWGHGGVVGPNGAYGWAGAGGPAGHWSRNWGWYNGYGPCWGNGRWDYLWNRYPVAMGFGATMWGLNAVAWTMGIGNYYNPYYGGGGASYPVAYNQPIIGDPNYETANVAAIGGTVDPLTQTFDQARMAFHSDRFQQALQLTDQALAIAPSDAAINEFRSLCLFALGRYTEAAATIHAVLAAGPGWDWTTMSSLYSNPDVYTGQLRKLETAVKSDPQSADDRFLLAYHYLTCDQKDAAVKMLTQVVQLEPKDQLSSELLKMYGPPPAAPAIAVASTTTSAPLDLAKPAWPMEKLQGAWSAKQPDGEFDLNLGADDAFTWKFVQDGKPQSVTGAYAVRGNNLVMQPDTGGTMISEIALNDDNTLSFSPIGDAEKLTFRR